MATYIDTHLEDDAFMLLAAMKLVIAEVFHQTNKILSEQWSV